MRKFYRIEFNEEQKQYLREHYPIDPVTDLEDHFQVSGPVIKRIAEEMGLQKVPGWRGMRYRNRYIKDYKIYNITEDEKRHHMAMLRKCQRCLTENIGTKEDLDVKAISEAIDFVIYYCKSH